MDTIKQHENQAAAHFGVDMYSDMDGACLVSSEKDGTLYSSGYHARQAATGDSAKLTADGILSRLAAVGDSSSLLSRARYTQIAVTGDDCWVKTEGSDSRQAATGGYAKLTADGGFSTVVAAGAGSAVEAGGYCSTAVAVGIDSTAMAGQGGCIALSWWDAANSRVRIAVGYVGEGGIEPWVWYKVNSFGEFVVDTDEDDL